ncbi:neprilysin-4-like [Wyeomyia smithii]|uniref:neprilysin-4-like n=1 Tax=Wyeomyia smithii TaxID=174621 RepID=UPI002467C737|nr:neprilysin-4-like [Wyeomyia smithii]
MSKTNQNNPTAAIKEDIIQDFRSTDFNQKQSINAKSSLFSNCGVFVWMLLVSSVACDAIPHGTAPEVCHTMECLRAAAAFKQSMDLAVDPCEDFYSYVCGNWADDHPRPEEQESYDWFTERQIKIYRNIMAHLGTNASRSDPKPVSQSKAMYRSCLNHDARKQEGFRAVSKYMRGLGLPAIPTLLNQSRSSSETYELDWISSVARIRRKLGLNVIIGFDIVPDYRDSNRNRLTFGYSSSSPNIQSPRYEWSKVGEQSEENDEEQNGREKTESYDRKEVIEWLEWIIRTIHPDFNTVALEEEFAILAEQYIDFYTLPEYENVDNEDPSYYTINELQDLTDSFMSPRQHYPIWQRYLDVLFADIPDAKPGPKEKLQIDNATIQYLQKLINFVSHQSQASIELHLWTTVADFIVNYALNEIQSEHECVKTVHRFMGLAVSYAIADRDFLTETKPRVEKMLKHIVTEFDFIVLKTDWMDAYTKYVTLEKSKSMKSLIGFPDWIMDTKKLEDYYKELQIDEGRYLENWVSAIQFIQTSQLRSWQVKNNQVMQILPTTLNAFNVRPWNMIYIPAAIIQYPFYYLGLEALNYGALGEILGHELTHGFDNSGRHYDKNGNMERWWSNHSLQEYDDRADCFVDQYSGYYVKEAKQYLNGSLTLGENIADNGGLREAYWAYKAFQQTHDPEPTLPGFEGFTHEQLFFISFAYQYCNVVSPTIVERQLKNQHSPSRFRVRGSLSNLQEFSDAFNCPTGSTMNPEKKCRIW